MDELQTQIEKLFTQNRRATDGFTYTIPSPELYPFQWLWDSCFHAIILSHFDVKGAEDELRSVCARPLSNGLLPHIIYWQYDTSVSNWGREQRGDVIVDAWGVTGTSSITQPPILAYALMRLYERSNDPGLLHELYPVVAAYYDHLLRERVHAPTGLALIINPDESGEDNSPRFDGAQQLEAQHTAHESLDRRIDRMREFSVCKYNVRHCMHQHFAVADISFNVILADSLAHLGAIAMTLGKTKDARRYERAGLALNQSILSHCDGGNCHSYDVTNDTVINDETWTLFMPLYGELLSQRDAENLVHERLLDPKQFWTPYGIPSTSMQSLAFDPDDGFWRGPVWMASNWFIYKGLERYGFRDVADELKQKSLALLSRSGFREHYHPLTGAGLGATDFTWGALVLDME